MFTKSQLTHLKGTIYVSLWSRLGWYKCLTPPRHSTTSPQIRRYLMRISGPLLDRIDIHVEVPRLNPNELMTRSVGESSASVRERVEKARRRQVERLRDEGITCNAQMGARQLREECAMEDGARDLLKTAINQLGLSARAYDRILKVARTIADLDGGSGNGGGEKIQLHHIAEAMNYRVMDRKLFG